MRLNKKELIAINICKYLVNKRGYENNFQIAYKANTTPHFCEQLTRRLKISGILKAKKGPNGGYKLKWDGTTYLEVIEAVSGPLRIEDDELLEEIEDLLAKKQIREKPYL